MSNVVNKTLLVHIPELMQRAFHERGTRSFLAFIEDSLEDLGYTETDLLDNHEDIKAAIDAEMIKIAKIKLPGEK